QPFPVGDVALLGVGERLQDLPVVALAPLGQLPVEAGLRTLIGQAFAPALGLRGRCAESLPGHPASPPRRVRDAGRTRRTAGPDRIRRATLPPAASRKGSP